MRSKFRPIPYDPESQAPDQVRLKLTHALTQYDRREEIKAEGRVTRTYNRYALAIMLARLDEAIAEYTAGKSLARALYDNFNDRVLSALERAAGLPLTYGGGRADKGRPG